MMKKIMVLGFFLFSMSAFAQYLFPYPIQLAPHANFYNTGVQFVGFRCFPTPNINYLNCQLALNAASGAYAYEIWGNVTTGFGLVQKALVARSANVGVGQYIINIPGVTRGSIQTFDLVARDVYGAAILTDRMQFVTPGVQINPFFGPNFVNNPFLPYPYAGTNPWGYLRIW